jgi:hypothetical protein
MVQINLIFASIQTALYFRIIPQALTGKQDIRTFSCYIFKSPAKPQGPTLIACRWNTSANITILLSRFFNTSSPYGTFLKERYLTLILTVFTAHGNVSYGGKVVNI